MIRIKYRDGNGDVFETMLLEDRPDVGPELRQFKAPGCDAGPTQVLDVPTEHCRACYTAIGDLIGLTDSEQGRIRRWREAAEMSTEDRESANMTAAELGRILDKIVKALDLVDDDDDHDTMRVVVEVEPTP
jgi:hypothetical protein